MKVSKGRIHVVIGDTQTKEGVPLDHLTWIGQYIVDQFAGQPDVTLVHVGDHADMPSLSSYDKGKKSMEGRRYKKDVDVANAAWALLNEPLQKHNRSRRKSGKKQWLPEKFITLGNHENRINVAVELDAQLEGVISTDDLNFAKYGWKVIPFLEVLWLNGVAYSHYFYNIKTGKPLSGDNLLPRLKTIGHSFTMGHQQGKQTADRFVGQKQQRGLVLGSTYLHEEKYMGPQADGSYWRGIVVCHNVNDGQYDLMEVSLEYLCKRYTGKTIEEFLKSRGASR